METTLHVFSFLKLKSNLRLIFDPMEPNVEKYNFMECDWHEFMPGQLRKKPNVPKPLGKGVTL